MIIKFKIFENKPMYINDLPLYKGKIKNKRKEEDFKYKINDIVYLKELDKHFIIKNNNTCSDTQDYYLVNPLNAHECGWAVEEELSDTNVNSENYNQIILKISSDKYNL